MPFRHQQPRKVRRQSNESDSDFDFSDGEDVPDSVVGPIEIPRSPSHPSSSRIGSTPGMKAPTHIDFGSGAHSPRQTFISGSAPQKQHNHKARGGTKPSELAWPQQIYRQWFGAITEGRSIQVHSILADHPNVLNMRRKEPTPFHMALTHIASEWLGNDTTGMDGLQVAIMGYKNAYANWRLGNGGQSEQMASMSADQMKEHVAVREVILGALIDAISPEQLDSHFFGRQQNTTLHLAAFYNDANLVERLLRQGAAVDIPNRMGFMPTNITNDKPTLQWLAMYQGQVRGIRYQTMTQSTSMPQQSSMHYYSPESNDDSEQYEKDINRQETLDASPMSVPNGSRTRIAEEEFEIDPFDQLSDDGDVVSESSYIKQFADSMRSMQPPTPEDNVVEHVGSERANNAIESHDSEDNLSDEDQHDSASAVSSSDRCSLGLGGGKGNLVSKSVDGIPARKRMLDSVLHSKESSRSNSRNSDVGSGNVEGANGFQQPLSSAPSDVSFHTANGVFSDGAYSPGVDASASDPQLDSEQQDLLSVSANSTMRIKVDPDSIDINCIEDIFNDEDDVMQMEPSYYWSGSGLSESSNHAHPSTKGSPTKHLSLVSSESSSASINLRALNNAMAIASVPAKTAAPASTAISAFPVVVQDIVPRGIDDSGKPLKALEQLKQQGQPGKDGQPQRATSPFLLRDSLYEMIMGRSTSRHSLVSVGSANSIALSNSSTVGASKDGQSSNGAIPISPTSPNLHISPTSTTFEDSNGSPSQTVISSPTNDTSFGTVIKSAPKVPETVKEEIPELENSDSPAFDSGMPDERARSSADNAVELAITDVDDAPGTRSSSPVALPRPTAASLFAAPDDQPSLFETQDKDFQFDEQRSHEHDATDTSASDNLSPEFHTPVGAESESKVDDFPRLPSVDFKAGRIGRRQGRATAEMLHDEPSGFSSEPSFNFAASELSSDNLTADKGSKTDASEGELDSPSAEPPSLPANVPLTKDKRDQYLQTLINRNTMRNGLPSKRGARSGIANAMRPDSPARMLGVSDAPESGDDGDAENDSAHQSPVAFDRNRHTYKRSEGAIEFGGSRSPSSLGLQDRSRDGDSRSRAATSQHTREALAVSGASINGRIRANTVTTHSPSASLQPLRPASAARKVSPSLAHLKTRNLVSNSPAKITSNGTPDKLSATIDSASPLASSPSRMLSINSSRIRSMTTPADATPPLLLTPSKQSESPLAIKPLAMLNGTSTARIGRVAALSQNFERQTSASPPQISIPIRSVTSVVAEIESADKSAIGVVSAPLGVLVKEFGSKPAARSNSISSSHSAGGHGQSTFAGDGSGGRPGTSRPNQSTSPKDTTNDGGNAGSGNGDNGGWDGADRGGGGNSGGGGGAGAGGRDDDSSGDKPSPNMRAAILDSISTDSNSSSSAHSSSAAIGRGLAANVQGDSSPLLLFDSRGSGDQIGSSIFSSTESISSSSKEQLHQSEPSQMNAKAASRPDSEAERKKRFKELADRRKSGTLERISNRGFVKSRRALLASSELDRPASPSSPGLSPAKSNRAKAQFVSSDSGLTDAGGKKADGSSFRDDSDQLTTTTTKPNTTSSFLAQKGEGQQRLQASTSAALVSAVASHPVSQLEGQTVPHPLSQQPSTAATAAVETILEQEFERARSAAVSDTPEGVVPLSRASSEDKSEGGSGSGEDSSLHILSSLDTNSTSESTPLDSVPENTNVGLLAQYNMNKKRVERQLKRASENSGYTYFSSGNNDPQLQTLNSDIELGLRTVSDTEDDPYTDDPEPIGIDVTDQPAVESNEPQSESEGDSQGFNTLMPSRPRYNSQALFGLSTVFEEDEESRNPSLVVSDVQRLSISNSASTMEDVPIRATHSEPSQGSSSATGSSSGPHSEGHVVEMQERRKPTMPLRGLRAALVQHPHQQQIAPVYQGLGPTGIPDVDQEDPPMSPSSPGLALGTRDSAAFVGTSSTSFVVDDDAQSRSPSTGSHTFDPNLVFGYTSEENSTMASRSSFERSELLSSGRPSSSASRVIYMHPFDPPESEGGYAGDSDSRSRTPLASTSRMGGASKRLEKSSLSSLSFDRADDEASSIGDSRSNTGKGKEPVRRMPEMQQIQPPVAGQPEHVPTVEEIEEDLSTDEEPIPKILFVASQDFEGYVPVAYKIREHREELRKEMRMKKEAAKQGITLPPAEPTKLVSPLWFMENNYLDPLPPDMLQMMAAERDKLMLEDLKDNHGITEHPDLKRALESSISTIRLREEFDATVAGDTTKLSASQGTIKPLSKRPRVSDIQGMFDAPEDGKDDSVPSKPREARKSFLDSIEIPVSDAASDSDSSSDASVEHNQGNRVSFYDEAFVSPISQEFQVPGDKDHPIPKYDPSFIMPRKKLVLRTRGRTFSERVMSEINEMDVQVRTDVHGTVNVHSAGQLAYEPPTGTVRPSMIPQYVSQLNGVPAGPFFMPPKATAKSGYLYMRILSIEDIEAKTDSVYFVIRNGIDTLATTPVSVAGVTGTTINQEFRILTDPSVSITMWMRFRSDAIIYKNGRSNNASRRYVGEPGCIPPLLKKLVRRNTRSRNNQLNCSSSADSVFDFASDPRRFMPGARKGGPGPGALDMNNRRPLGPGYPERVSSAFMSQNGQRFASNRSDAQQGFNGYNDPRSLNATQAPSSVFYEPGSDMMDHPPSRKGLAHAKFKEETRGVAVVHVGEMIEEVFLRGLVDSWDVENVWESRKGARLQLQLFYIPECPLFREEELPKTLSECEMAMEVCSFHNRTLNSGYMSQRGGDTRFWRRRYFRLIGGFLFAYHEDTKEPRCFIDLNDATRIVDHQAERARRTAASPGQGQAFGNADLMRSMRARRRVTHKRNNSDHSSRDGAAAAAARVAERGSRPFMQAPGHEYASDSEPAELVDIADPTLQRMSQRRGRVQQQQQRRGELHNSRDTNASAGQQSGRTDSGIVSVHSSDGASDNAMQYSFSIEFSAGGSIEFYTESESEKRVWVEIIKRVIGSIPKIPSWLIKLLHADVSERIDSGSAIASASSIGNVSTPSSKFSDLTHPQLLAR
ncbi:Bud site selection protein bud4 [Coemansia spiralis]|uniref:Bud site selection protein bud4 n=2 Tax=Coemansia TaxID=4863 RepID=A0A9W8GET0_9FUNG|nr:Bud site selection protein bud4 [Coemansia umbellata]KAJ2625970.1 Bud site selection protein bud4 [Coemansia sp. RSA 1358]KAJ2680700.1 Bud site selection protein bud4 [Coemansia spiralis]